MDKVVLMYRCRRCGELFEGQTINKNISWILADNKVYMRYAHKCNVKNMSIIGVADIVGVNYIK